MQWARQARVRHQILERARANPAPCLWTCVTWPTLSAVSLRYAACFTGLQTSCPWNFVVFIFFQPFFWLFTKFPLASRSRAARAGHVISRQRPAILNFHFISWILPRHLIIQFATFLWPLSFLIYHFLPYNAVHFDRWARVVIFLPNSFILKQSKF